MTDNTLANDEICEIIIIRHGETDWNRRKIIQGKEDIPMNETGCEQIRASDNNFCRHLIQITPDVFCDKRLQNSTNAIKHENVLNVAAIYTSPLCRATKSAEIIADYIQFPKNEIKVEKGVVEWNAGVLQGIPISDIPLKYPLIWEKWRTSRDPHFCIPNGESFLQRYNRVVNVFQNLATRHPSQRILVVCHAGVLDDVYRRATLYSHHNQTTLPKINAGVHILHVPSKPYKNNDTDCEKWKILRWGNSVYPLPSPVIDDSVPLNKELANGVSDAKTLCINYV